MLQTRLLVDKLFGKKERERKKEWRQRHLANWMVYKRWYFKLGLNMKEGGGGGGRGGVGGVSRL